MALSFNPDDREPDRDDDMPKWQIRIMQAVVWLAPWLFIGCWLAWGK